MLISPPSQQKLTTDSASRISIYRSERLERSASPGASALSSHSPPFRWQGHVRRSFRIPASYPIVFRALPFSPLTVFSLSDRHRSLHLATGSVSDRRRSHRLELGSSVPCQAQGRVWAGAHGPSLLPDALQTGQPGQNRAFPLRGAGGDRWPLLPIASPGAAMPPAPHHGHGSSLQALPGHGNS